MNVIVGLVILFVCVFGGYIIAGGKFGIIIAALPFEMMMIGGAAVGAFVMSNGFGGVKHTLHGFGKVMKGARFKKPDYVDLLSLLYYFVRLAQTKGAMALEPHIEKPEESAAFSKFPNIQKDHHAVHADLRLPAHDRHERRRPAPDRGRDGAGAEEGQGGGAARLARAADHGGRPARAGHRRRRARRHQDHGRRSTSRPPVLGEMIGGALVGTFLGVLLAYGMVGPMATRLKGVVEEECLYYEVIRAVLVAHLHGNAPQVAVETGRKVVPSDVDAELPGARGRAAGAADRLTMARGAATHPA